MASRDHDQRHGAIRRAMKVFGFKPRAKPGIVNLGLVLPEVGIETALDAEMPELQFDVLCPSREVAPDVFRSDVESGDTMTFAMRFDDHKVPALQNRLRVESPIENRKQLT